MFHVQMNTLPFGDRQKEPIKENITDDTTPWGKALIQYVLQVTGSICSFFKKNIILQNVVSHSKKSKY